MSEIYEYDPDASPDHSADNAADFIFRELSNALGVNGKWSVCDGTETWDGDVRGTLYQILIAAGIWDDDEGKLRTRPQPVEPPDDGLVERDRAGDAAWRFVRPKLIEIKQESGLAGVWSTGFRTGWDAAQRAYADTITSLRNQLASVTRDKDAIEADVLNAIGPTVRFMDPPDGGSPSLGDMVRNMHSELLDLEAKLSALEQAQPVAVTEELIEQLLDAQQDINLAANETMNQSLCDASALIDKIEPILRAIASPQPTPPASEAKMEVTEALRGLVLCKNLFDASDRNQADAYYLLAKQDAIWDKARAALQPLGAGE